MHEALARQMSGQRAPCWPALFFFVHASRRNRNLDVVGCNAGFEFGKLQFELVQEFAAALR